MRFAELSVVVPAKDEVDVIAGSVRAIRGWLEANVERFEIVVVDDGSTDGTGAALAPLVDGECVRVLRHESCRGKGAAVRTGVAATRFEAVLFTDADLSMPIEAAEDLLVRLADADVVIASKHMRGARLDYPWRRRIGSALGQFVVRLCIVRGVTDTQAGFKLMRGDAARAIFTVQRLDGFGFDFEVLHLAKRYGLTLVEVPFRGRHRVGGSVSLKSYVRTLGEVGRVVWARLRGRYPEALPRLEARRPHQK